MKKITTVILLIIVLAVSLTGCLGDIAWNVAKLKESKYIDEIQDTMVTITIGEAKIYPSTEKLTLTIKNALGVDTYFGHSHHLEVLLEGKWYVIPLNKNAVWTEEMRVLTARSEAVEYFNLSTFYDDLLPGTYRIIKTLYMDDGSPIEASVEFDIYID